jgi:hypothetical protein
MNGGWQNFGFKNQGQCVSSVAKRQPDDASDQSVAARLVSAITPGSGSGATLFGIPFVAMLTLAGALGTRRIRRRRRG